MLKIWRSRDRLIFNMGIPILVWRHLYIETAPWAHFVSFARSKLRLCSANHRAGYFSNLARDWLSIVWAYSEQETENRPWFNIKMLPYQHRKYHCRDKMVIWWSYLHGGPANIDDVFIHVLGVKGGCSNLVRSFETPLKLKILQNCICA